MIRVHYQNILATGEYRDQVSVPLLDQARFRQGLPEAVEACQTRQSSIDKELAMKHSQRVGKEKAIES